MDRKFANIVFLLIAGQMVGEYWHLYDGPNVRLVDWFVFPPRYLPDITFYVKDICDSLSKMIWFYAFYLLAKRVNQRLAGVALVFIFYFACELILFFLCYKVWGYPLIYVCTGMFTFLILYKKRK